MRPDAKFTCDGEWDVAQPTKHARYWLPYWSEVFNVLSYYAVRISVIVFILVLLWLVTL
jgi:hypothetical protein